VIAQNSWFSIRQSKGFGVPRLEPWKLKPSTELV
jgi:hypothetical protein